MGRTPYYILSKVGLQNYIFTLLLPVPGGGVGILNNENQLTTVTAATAVDNNKTQDCAAELSFSDMAEEGEKLSETIFINILSL